MLENYLTYLKIIDTKVNSFFNKQKPYIFCQKGCGKCCKHAQFPYSQIEFTYLMEGMKTLKEDKIKIIKENVSKIKSAKENSKEKKFLYDCPFLIENVCSLYEYRGIVCRTFGLITSKDNKTKVPFCCFEGLNYSNVIGEDGKTFSVEKFKKLNVKEEPIIFNVDYDFLTESDFEEGFHFKFGEKKPLIDWF